MANFVQQSCSPEMSTAQETVARQPPSEGGDVLGRERSTEHTSRHTSRRNSQLTATAYGAQRLPSWPRTGHWTVSQQLTGSFGIRESPREPIRYGDEWCCNAIANAAVVGRTSTTVNASTKYRVCGRSSMKPVSLSAFIV